VNIPFEIYRTPATMRARVEDLRRDGRRIAVVPTILLFVFLQRYFIQGLTMGSGK